MCPGQSDSIPSENTEIIFNSQLSIINWNVRSLRISQPSSNLSLSSLIYCHTDLTNPHESILVPKTSKNSKETKIIIQMRLFHTDLTDPTDYFLSDEPHLEKLIVTRISLISQIICGRIIFQMMSFYFI